MSMPAEKLPPRGKTLSEFARERVDRPTPKRRAPRVGPHRVEAARERVAAMRESGEWETATPDDLVALYESLHREVYGVEALEMDAKNRALAAQAARRLVEQHFPGDTPGAVTFMSWAWRREQSREQWRRQNGKSGSRVGWRLQFSATLVTDWKLDVARQGSGGT